MLGVALLLAGCTAPAPAPSQSAEHTITVDGEQRTYLLTPPTQDDAALVLMLHGGLGSGAQAQRGYNWDELAATEGFAVAYPNGVSGTWNAGDCCGPAQRDGVDDVAFLLAVVDDISAQYSIDPARIYATGMSNGALMSYRLACDTDVFAAIGPVAGTLVIDCPNPAPISLLHIHGEADDNVPLDGTIGDGVGRVDGTPVADAVGLFRAADDCPEPTTTVVDGVTTTAAECPDGRAVELITIAGAGHQWPGSQPIREFADPPSTALDATAVLWDFFANHPKH